MSPSSWKVALIAAFIYLNGAVFLHASSPKAKRPFTVADDIQLAVFGGSWGIDEELLFSPNRAYFVVETERGRPDLNSPQDSLRFYRCQDVKDFVSRSNESDTPSPIWTVSRSTNKEGPIFKKWRWLPDSSGVAFLLRKSDGNYRLVLADLRMKRVESLTDPTETVSDFDVRDRQHYAYTKTGPVDQEKMRDERKSPAVVGTGRSLFLFQLLFPGDSRFFPARNNLWAVIGGKRFEVKQGGAPLTPNGGLGLSPNGASVLTALPVPEVPPSWETLYPPPFISDAYRIHAGRGSAMQWVRISLQTGSVQFLTGAPLSSSGGLWAGVLSGPSWSSWSRDGQAVLLPGTFLKSKENTPSRPCIAVVDLSSDTRTCVEMLKGKTEAGAEEGFHHIQEARFVDGDKRRVSVRFRRREDLYSFGTVEYQRTAEGAWRTVRQSQNDSGGDDLEVLVKQGLSEPPQVVAKYKGRSGIIWDPNPQLKNIELGQASVFKWKDEAGREWRGGLFKPGDYKPGRRYPLVIQTHGFTESKFIPSGIFPTTFAARALAAVGILVLQVSENTCPQVTTEEGSCVVSGYRSAVNQLVSEGSVDPDQVGIIGFSRSCFWVMEALTHSPLRLKAASITDGLMAEYFQYMLNPDWIGSKEFEGMIGAKPFGEGLQQWLKRSPGFMLDKINAPLMVVGEGPVSVLNKWEPYAGLRYLHKPVDVIMLNTHEHVLTNPAVRMASQGGTVDWFRFWLKGEEDTDPSKAGQYARWHELRTLQEENDKKNQP